MKNESPVQVLSLSRRSLDPAARRPRASASPWSPRRRRLADPAGQSITIGALLPEKAARDLASRFVRATGVAAGETPAARWVAPICPEVLGLEDIGKRAAEAKIRRVAAAVGADVAPEGCRRNIVVSFTGDGASLARAVVEREPWRVAESLPAREDGGADRLGADPLALYGRDPRPPRRRPDDVGQCRPVEARHPRRLRRRARPSAATCRP